MDAYASWKQEMKALKSTIDIDRLCDLLGIKKPSDMEWFSDETYGYVYDQEMKEHGNESVAEEKAIEAETEELDGYWKRYVDAIDTVAGRLFDKHNLSLIQVRGKSWLYKVEPKNDWLDSAKQIMETINGVGYFYFPNVEEFLESGPYTARQAVLSHLHWIKDYPRVYGDGTVNSMMDRELRY